MSRNVLTRRLAELVDAGLLRREPYQERPCRYDYLLTEKALELWPALVGLGGWGAKHADARRLPARVHPRASAAPWCEAVAHCPHCDVHVDPEDAGSRPGPGYRGTRRSPRSSAQPSGAPGRCWPTPAPAEPILYGSRSVD